MLAYTSVFTPDWAAGEATPGIAVMRAKTSFEPHARRHETPGKPPKVHTCVVPESKDQLARDVAATRARSDIVVCSLHWGVSAGHVNLTAYQVELAHHAIDVGADPVFGHHPHCLQGIEVYRGKAIFYSLGNFSFARHNPGAGHELETCILRCSLQDRRITTVEYLPVCCDARLDPHLLSVAEGRALVGIIEERSAAFGTAFGESERDPGYAVGRCWCKRTSRPVIRSVVYGKPFDAN